VTLDRIVERKVRAIVNVNGAPAPGVAVAKVSQASSEVVVEGPESAVNEVDRVIGYIGLTGKNDSDFDIQVPMTAINAEGREVQEVVVKPSKMYVSIQMARGLMKKIVTVQASIADDLGKGYEFVGSKVDPLKIEIAGNEKAIAGVDTLMTEKISLAGVTGNTDRTVKLVLPEGIAVTNQEVVVHLLVKEKKKE
jgi:YbbR domain-containing protein